MAVRIDRIESFAPAHLLDIADFDRLLFESLSYGLDILDSEPEFHTIGYAKGSTWNRGILKCQRAASSVQQNKGRR